MSESGRDETRRDEAGRGAGTLGGMWTGLDWRCTRGYVAGCKGKGEGLEYVTPGVLTSYLLFFPPLLLDGCVCTMYVHSMYCILCSSAVLYACTGVCVQYVHTM